MATAVESRNEASPLLNDTKNVSSPMSPLSPPSDRVDRHSICGVAPGGIAAHSNHLAEKEPGFSMNFERGFQTGMKWQCVEFARRWLLHRKGLVLPDVYFAAHLFLLDYVYDAQDVTKKVPTRSVRNGTTEKPQADSLIIYSTQFDSFPGHVGVITEVGDDFVRVADQNRYFHKWGECSYSMEFPLEYNKEKNTWTIVDVDEVVLGWVLFPGVDNREEGTLCAVQEGVKEAPGFEQKQHLKFFRTGFREVHNRWKVPYAIKFVTMTTLFMVVFPAVNWVRDKFSGSKKVADAKTD